MGSAIIKRDREYYDRLIEQYHNDRLIKMHLDMLHHITMWATPSYILNQNGLSAPIYDEVTQSRIDHIQKQIEYRQQTHYPELFVKTKE